MCILKQDLMRYYCTGYNKIMNGNHGNKWFSRLGCIAIACPIKQSKMDHAFRTVSELQRCWALLRVEYLQMMLWTWWVNHMNQTERLSFYPYKALTPSSTAERSKCHILTFSRYHRFVFRCIHYLLNSHL